MLVIIGDEGVNPPAYSKFVDYTVGASGLSNDTIGTTFAKSLYVTTSNVVLLILFVVWFVFVTIMLITFHKGIISLVTVLIATAAFTLLIVIYYILATLYEKNLAYKLITTFESSIVDTFVYSANSVVRDVIFLGTCR